MKKSEAFTLTEILIAVLIMGVLMGMMAGPVARYLKRAKVTSTKKSMETLKSALLLYQNDKGKYPTAREGLEVLLGEYIDSEKSIRDSWGNEFEYNSPPAKYKQYRHYEIVSYGEDGQEGEEDMHVGY